MTQERLSTPSGSGTSLSYKLDVIAQNIALGLPMGQLEMRFITQAARMLETSPVSETGLRVCGCTLDKDGKQVDVCGFHIGQMLDSAEKRVAPSAGLQTFAPEWQALIDKTQANRDGDYQQGVYDARFGVDRVMGYPDAHRRENYMRGYADGAVREAMIRLKDRLAVAPSATEGRSIELIGLALDRMIESLDADIASEEPGNHATIGGLVGERNGLKMARELVRRQIEEECRNDGALRMGLAILGPAAGGQHQPAQPHVRVRVAVPWRLLRRMNHATCHKTNDHG
jgi:hypothetical protein